MNRRELLRLGGGVALASGALPQISSAQTAAAKSGRRIGPVITFGKHLQWLSFDEVAGFLEENDFDGIEATVRKGGQVEPENVERDLPLLVDALKKRGREVVMITTDINDSEPSTSQRVIKTADGLGIRYFRMAYYRYDLERPIIQQLETHRKTALRLSEYLNDFQIMGVYQNHAGSTVVGGSVWDQYRLLEGVPEDRLGAAFDVRHATVEGGLSWPVLWRLMCDRTRVVYIKDFRWEGRKAANVPLGTGQVDPALLKMVCSEVDPGTPLSLHMEYVDHRDPAKKMENMKAIARDRQALRQLAGV